MRCHVVCVRGCPCRSTTGGPSPPWRTRSTASPTSTWSSANPSNIRTELIHERVAVVRRRDELLLDRARRDPADEVPHRAGLVIRAGRPRAAERLLADDRAGRLVVHVEVAGRVAEPVLGGLDGGAVLREHRAREPVRRAAVDEVERVLVAVLVVDERCDDRAEE